MKHMNFKVDVKAPKEKVWDVLWKDETYRKWTAPFTEGSYAESDWNEGSKILFLGPSGDGMFSRIDKKVSPTFMSFEHLGMIKGGVEQPEDEETKKWAGAKENYTLSEKDGGTELKVDLDVADDGEQYFIEAFPKALDKVKSLAEQ